MLASLGDGLQERKEIVEVADLLFVDENICVLKDSRHVVGVCDKVRAEVTLVELHTFNSLEGSLDALRFLNSDGSVFTNFVHCISDDLADFRVRISRDCGH